MKRYALPLILTLSTGLYSLNAVADISANGSGQGDNLSVNDGATFVTINSSGGDSITVNSGGTVSGDGSASSFAINFDGNLDQLINNGTISSVPSGSPDLHGAIDIDGDHYLRYFLNTGLVQGGSMTDTLDAISIEGTIDQFINEATGRFIGSDDGVRVDGSNFSGQVNHFTNAGLIQGMLDDGIQLEYANITSLQNSGTIEGLYDNGLELYESSIQTIINSGTISGDDDGINLFNTSFTNLINSGSIIGVFGDGIDIDSDSPITITDISNTGLIQGGDFGIEIGDSTTLIDNISNDGAISGGDVGIYISSDASISQFDNNGTVIGLGSDGLYMDSATINLLDNSGTLEGAGPSGADSSGIYASNSTITTLINSSMNSIRGTDHGIHLSSGSTIISLTNTGLIYGGDSPSTTSGDPDSGITVTDADSVITTLNNSGLISGYDGDSAGNGIVIDASGEITTLENSGTVIGDDYAILITGGNAITINNSGVLSGDVDLDSTASVMNLTGSSTRIIGDTLGSATTVNILGNFATEGGFDISEMDINNNAELALFNDITASGSGGLSNSGTLAVSPGRADNLTLTGNYTQASSGTLIVDYNSAIGPGNEGSGSDLLSVSGDAVIAGKILFSSSDTADVASTTPIKIVEAGSVTFSGEIEGIQGNFGDLSSFGGSFTNSLGFSALASDPDPVAVYASDNVVLDTTALFLSGSCGLNSTAADHQRSGGIYRHSHGDCLTPGRSTLEYDSQEQDAWWVRTILTKGAQASTIDSNGYKYKTYGLIAGKSVSQDENWSNGISIGMLRGQADKNNGGSDSTDSVYVGLQRDYIDGEHFYNMGLTLGLNRFDFERNMTIDGASVKGTGDTMGWTLGARIAAGLEQKTGDNSYARPMISLSYIQLHKQGYNESGLADFGLQIEDQTLRDLRANLGVEVSYDFPAEKNSTVIESTLAVKLGMSHQQALDNRQYNVRFTNFADPFVIEGDNSSLTMMRLGLGWTRHIDRSSNMFIGYDAGFSSEREEHTLNFGLRKVW